MLFRSHPDGVDERVRDADPEKSDIGSIGKGGPVDGYEGSLRFGVGPGVLGSRGVAKENDGWPRDDSGGRRGECRNFKWVVGVGVAERWVT